MTRKNEITKIAEQLAGDNLKAYLNSGRFNGLLKLAEVLYDLGCRYKEPKRQEFDKIYDVIITVKVQKRESVTNKKERLACKTTIVSAEERYLENNVTSVNEMIKKGILNVIKEFGL